jgi:hypothetical protein
MVDGGRGRWSVGADELIFFTMDVTTAGHSTSKSTGGARTHRFLP